MSDRCRRGNGTAYDWFLCSFVGDTDDCYSPYIPPLTQTGPSGREYSYNQPYLMRRSAGDRHLVVMRSLSGILPAEDESIRYFVATLDLETGTATRWNVLRVRGGDWDTHQPLWLQLAPAYSQDRSGITPAVRQPGRTLRAEGDNPFARSLQGAPVFDGSVAQLMYARSEMSAFIPPGEPAESLYEISELVQKVNWLTDAYGLTGRLDELRMADEARRAGAAHPLAAMSLDAYRVAA